MKLISITLAALYCSVCLADLYMHVPRGSNNRLNEKSANRANANRAFDSQNNNRGGYNVGEFGSQNGFQNNNNAYATNSLTFNYDQTAWANNNGNGRKQQEEVFLEGSAYSVTWTAQHGCGNAKNNCNMVMEYTCDTHDQGQTNILNPGFQGTNGQAAQSVRYQQDASWRNYNTVNALRVRLSNGRNTDTPDDPNNIRQARQTFNNNNNNGNFRAESEESYAFAKQFNRNKGLFTADQNLQGDDSTKTRQNPGGTRSGLETPEERDYFPYWKPTIWRPLAIMTNNVAECTAQMQQKSAAVETKTACYPTKGQINGQKNNNQLNNIINQETQADCEAADGVWVAHKYDMAAPPCIQNNWSQVNNLGNAKGTDNGGLPQTVNWNYPSLDAIRKADCFIYRATEGDATQDFARIQMRMRYNMSTMDYAPYATTAACNQDDDGNVQSPVQQNPTVDVGSYMQGLKLAINTAQTGRTFQDRSHVIRVMARPKTAAAATIAQLQPAVNVQNIVIQGKRGNIVQTFPAVEYDFYPKEATVKVGDCLAMQWTGSNTHNNGNPGGDGQTGDAGEGRGGSDRSNLVQLMDKNSTFPIPLDKIEALTQASGGVIKDFFAESKVYQTYTGKEVDTGTKDPQTGEWSNRDAQLYFMSGGYYNKEDYVGNDNGGQRPNLGNNNELNVLLNNAPATMRSMTVCPTATAVGEYTFASTRNNNFSNRDQKLTIKVIP